MVKSLDPSAVSPVPRLSRLQWCCSVLLVVLAFAVRVWMLDYKPAHFDEGVNGHFVDEMRATGVYAYDPANYHGPLHFYVLFAGQQLFGRSLWVLRMPTVLLGVGVVVLLLAFRRFLPFRAVALAALFTAVSPAMIFYSRYAIHEMWLPFFALLAAYGGCGLAQGERRRADLWCLALGVTGMVLTKETYLLHFVAALLALAIIAVVNFIVRRPAGPRRPRPIDLFTGQLHSPESTELNPALPGAITTRDVLAAGSVSLGLLVAFYSGFGLYWPGVPGIFTTFSAMQVKATTGEDGHFKEAFYWLKLMASYEWPALAGLLVALFIAVPRSIWLGALFVLGGVGLLCLDLKDHPALQAAPPAAAVAVAASQSPDAIAAPLPGSRKDDFLPPNLRLKPEGVAGAVLALLGLAFFLALPASDRTVHWLALYGLASLAAYSLIPYKTPWCSINFLWPFCLVLGWALDRLITRVSRISTLLVILLLLYANLPDAYRLNFINPVNDAVGPVSPLHVPVPRYAYVQTTFDLNDLLRPLNALIARDPRNRQITGLIVPPKPLPPPELPATENHPLQWYLGDLPNVAFPDPQIAPLPSYDAGFIIVPVDQADEIEPLLTTRYFRSNYLPRGSSEPCFLYLEETRFESVLPPDRVPEVIPLRPPANATP